MYIGSAHEHWKFFTLCLQQFLMPIWLVKPIWSLCNWQQKDTENPKIWELSDLHFSLVYLACWNRKDFRPAYSKLGLLGSLFPDIPLLGLTATATKAMHKKIEDSVGMIHPREVLVNPNFIFPLQGEEIVQMNLLTYWTLWF